MSIGTKKALADSLLDLCKTMPMQKITINDITKHCVASRQTFYNYFYDKQELIEWIFTSNYDSFQEEFKDLDRFAVKTARLFYENKKFYTTVMLMKGQNCFYETFNKMSYENMRNHIVLDFGPQKLTEVVDYSLEFWISGASSMLLKWIMSGMPFPPEELVDKNKKYARCAAEIFFVSNNALLVRYP